jgi:hypothetical protein
MLGEAVEDQLAAVRSFLLWSFFILGIVILYNCSWMGVKKPFFFDQIVFKHKHS